MSLDSPGTVRLTDPRTLRAYAHPVRLRLMALLRQSGPQTATQAALAIGESVPSCSFHLRQLAKYGLVEPGPGGRGREKPWQATAMMTDWADAVGDSPAAEAALSLELALARQYFELVTRWLSTRAAETAKWRHAAQFGDSLLQLTAEELQELGRQIDRLIEPFRARTADPEVRPDGTRPVVMLQIAVPSQILGPDVAPTRPG